MSDLRPILAHLLAGRTLCEAQAFDAFSLIMSGQSTDAQIASLLTALAMRRGVLQHPPHDSPDSIALPSIDELTGAARAMRQHAARLTLPPGVDPVDTCGTGGDHAGTFNISTAAALIAAGAGVPIAKHGNRSVTSKSGSSQVLEALGVKLATPGSPPENLAQCLAEANICFCFAPAHHPAMKHAVGPRQQLGFRTIFNLLGPLTNPAGARRQVIGVYDNALTELFAHVLRNLGAVHAMIVHGKTLASPDSTHGGSGLDEITTTGPTRITTLRNDAIETVTLHPQDLGLAPASIADLAADGPESSAAVIRCILAGHPGPARDIAALNAAAALVVADKAPDLPAGLRLAFASIDTGSASRSLDTLIRITNSA